MAAGSRSRVCQAKARDLRFASLSMDPVKRARAKKPCTEVAQKYFSANPSFGVKLQRSQPREIRFSTWAVNYVRDVNGVVSFLRFAVNNLSARSVESMAGTGSV